MHQGFLHVGHADSDSYVSTMGIWVDTDSDASGVPRQSRLQICISEGEGATVVILP